MTKDITICNNGQLLFSFANFIVGLTQKFETLNKFNLFSTCETIFLKTMKITRPVQYGKTEPYQTEPNRNR